MRYYCGVWPHAVHNCVPVRIIHACDLSNSSITLTSKGHTRLVHVFAWYPTKSDRHVLRRMLLKPKYKCTDYRLLGTDKKKKHFSDKSKVTILTNIHMWYHMSTSILDQHAPQQIKVVQKPHRILVLLHTTYDEFIRIVRVRVKSTWYEPHEEYK